MKLTVEFNSYQELDDFVNGVAIAPALLDLEANASEIEIKEAVKEIAKEEKPKKAKKEVKEEEAKAEDVMPEPEPAEEEQPKEEAKHYAIEDVRAVLGKLQKAGKKEEVKELITSFGVDKLSQIKEEDYVALIEKAGALNE